MCRSLISILEAGQKMQPGSFSLLTMYSIRQGAHKTFTRFSYSSIISPVNVRIQMEVADGRLPRYPEAEPGLKKKIPSLQ